MALLPDFKQAKLKEADQQFEQSHVLLVRQLQDAERAAAEAADNQLIYANEWEKSVAKVAYAHKDADGCQPRDEIRAHITQGRLDDTRQVRQGYVVAYQRRWFDLMGDNAPADVLARVEAKMAETSTMWRFENLAVLCVRSSYFNGEDLRRTIHASTNTV